MSHALRRGRRLGLATMLALVAMACGTADAVHQDTSDREPLQDGEPLALGCGPEEGTTGAQLELLAGGVGAPSPSEAINRMLPRVAHGTLDQAPADLGKDPRAAGYAITSQAGGGLDVQYRTAERAEARFSITPTAADTWQVDGYEICNRSYRPNFPEYGEGAP